MGLRAGMLAPALNGERTSRLCAPLLGDPPPQAAWPAMPGGGLLETLGGTTRGPKFGPASRCMKIDERYARESSECDNVALLQEN